MTQAISGDAKPSHSHGHCHSHHKVHSECDYPQPHLHNHRYCQQDEPKINPDEVISRNLRPLWIVIPFLLLFLLKEAVLHSTGLWVLVSLFVSSYYLNTRLTNATQGFEPPIYALVASVIVCATLIFMHNVWIFKKNEIYLGLFCMPNAIPSSDWVSLLWAVIVVDFSLKIITIFIKSVLIYFSPRFFHISTRNALKCWLKVYTIQRLPNTSVNTSPLSPCLFQSAILVWMEFISQFYRSVPPAVTWIRHLTDGLTRSLGFRIVFCLLYILLKPYQTNVVSSLEDQELCNLCLEKRSRDVAILGCNHTFCRNCIDRWLIHFDECPLCSHPLGGELRAWRDGSTSALVHFF
ncbi:RING finger and transmembrane domain-containing protein 2 [Echinococcus granulosus]|uniref:RING finger and transmembrane domain-containing protein 2 n=1 Tax=Echinococcus granulosus TaxID=6210 RepID=W6UHS7_ECHGR|nr:RING finger and transmembrane domain-containing protein 2 [Echinococcus granulosus]EUB57647.1 RING finger and transmembrane domain-containing protein 2 [Echinococcus granulosus]